MTRWSAPGKLFLFGEYAVLGSAWSIVCAVDRRVFAEVRPGDAYTIDGAEASPDLPGRVLQEASSTIDIRTVHCDVTSIYEQGQKLGLGSSAASCAAIAALALGGGSSPDRVFEVAGRAHRAFQGGRGSHADVATSVFGGLLAYRLKEPVAPFPRLAAGALAGQRDVAFAEIVELTWPETARARAFWLGKPAYSPELIGRVEPAVASGESAALTALEQIAVSSEMALAALTGGADITEAVTAGHEAMVALGTATGAPIVTPEALDVFESARRAGISGKMSGAGGGDFVLLVGPHSAAWATLQEAHPGLWVDLSFDVPGVRAE